MNPASPSQWCVHLCEVAIFCACISIFSCLGLADCPSKGSGTQPEPGPAADPGGGKPQGVSEDSKPADEKPAFLSVVKGLEIKLYGHLRLDASRDEAETNDGNTAMWVKPDKGKEEFNITARHTRVGLDFKGARTLGVSPSGKVEIDFYGKGSEIQQNVRLRHAFLRFDLGGGVFLLAGQTSDLHASLIMQTLNTAIGWNHGNLGFRRPQIRMGMKMEFANDAAFLAEAGVARAIGMMLGGDLDGGTADNDDGEDAARPDIQVNATLFLPSAVEGKPVRLMFGGHYGQEFLSTLPRFVESWSWASGISLPLIAEVTFEAEFWMGSNLDAYRSGINQGYNISLGRAVLSRGGFAQVILESLWRFSVCAGFGIDDPYNGHVSAGKPSSNRSFFANVKFRMCKGGFIAFEYQRFWTDYLRAEMAMDNRFQLTCCLKY